MEQAAETRDDDDPEQLTPAMRVTIAPAWDLANALLEAEAA
jgi:hypothetical protein